MAIRIPEAHQAPLRILAAMEPALRRRFAQTLQSMEPVLDPDSFISIAAQESAIDSSEAAGLVEMLVSMVLAARGEREEFVRDVVEAARPLLRDVTLDWGAFADDLNTIMRAEGSLGVSAKVAGLRGEYENVYYSARVLTDIRPVFGADPTSKPVAGAVVHTLRLTFHQTGSESRNEFYVAMDSKDLTQLRQLLDRAAAKEVSLASVIEEAGMKYLPA